MLYHSKISLAGIHWAIIERNLAFQLDRHIQFSADRIIISFGVDHGLVSFSVFPLCTFDPPGPGTLHVSGQLEANHLLFRSINCRQKNI